MVRLPRILGARRGVPTPVKPQLEQTSDPAAQWFWDHFNVAAGEIVNFCESRGVRLSGLDIADVGCGDGIMALGLCHRIELRTLVGFDVNLTDTDVLLQRARQYGVADALPAELTFRSSSPTTTPADDASFDFVYSWSAFEHIADPILVLGEIRRILRPQGSFFLQLWPFYRSSQGAHLWDWFDDPFHHLRTNDRDIVAHVRASDRHSDEWTRYMSQEFERLNRITVDELQRSVQSAGFVVRAVELIATPIHLTHDLARYRWTDLAIGGIKLIACALPTDQ